MFPNRTTKRAKPRKISQERCSTLWISFENDGPPIRSKFLSDAVTHTGMLCCAKHQAQARNLIPPQPDRDQNTAAPSRLNPAAMASSPARLIRRTVTAGLCRRWAILSLS